MSDPSPSLAPARDDLHDVAVVVVTYGSHDLVERHLGTAGLDGTGATVVVVDNFFSDAERVAHEQVAARHRWQLVALPDNVGFGAAANRGVAHALEAGAQVVVLLNPDASIDADTLAGLAAAARAEPRALVAPRVVRPDGTTWSAGNWLHLASGHMGSLTRSRPAGESMDWITGACFATSAQWWRRLGGFDEAYFLYWEDVDLSRRCLDAGGQVTVRDDLTVVHAVGGTQGDRKSLLYYRYNTRNRLRFAAKHLGRRDLVRWLLATPWLTVQILGRDGGRKRLLHSPRLVWAGVRGSSAGALDALRAVVRPERTG